MRKIFFILTCTISSTSIFAQEPADALRSSWIISSGTARQQAVGGAMTSLGGDLSAAYVNPAGLGFYKTGDFVITPGFNLWRNKSTYYGRTEQDKKNNLSFGTTGVVLGTGTKDRKKNKCIFCEFSPLFCFNYCWQISSGDSGKGGKAKD